MNKLLELLGKLPTTQARVLTSLVCILGTTIRYVASEQHVLSNGTVQSFWEPSYEWLGFLIVLSGLDVGQFLVKRATDSDYVAAKSGTAPQPGVTP